MTLLLVLLAILAVVAFGFGFIVKWLFILAAILALVWLVALLTGGVWGPRRTTL